MTLFDSLMGGLGSNGGGASVVAYKNVRLVEDSHVDLYVHNSRGKGIFSYDAWLEEGRPRQLSSLNLATWSLLTTSIKEYQLGLRQYAGRIYVRMVLPVYLLWVVSLMIVGVDEEAENQQRDVLYMTFSWMGLVVMIAVSLLVAKQFQQKHVDQVFNPAVQSVLEELRPKLTESGWEVVLMVETGQWCIRPTKSFLRFTPLPDEEKLAQEQQN